VEPLEDIGTAQVPTAPDAAQLAMDNIATDSAIALLSELPEQQAQVIMLRVLAGLDTDVIAEILGTTAGNVRVAAHRGLRKLEALLSGGGVASRAGVTL
jgi:RNA polymerase sigma-70 factor (ECF subfamily)